MKAETTITKTKCGKCGKDIEYKGEPYPPDAVGYCKKCWDEMYSGKISVKKVERFNIANKPPARIAFKLRSARGNPVYVEDKRKEKDNEVPKMPR